MTLGLLEAAMDALGGYLETHMANKVTELNARYSDEYALKNVKAWHYGNLPTAMPESPSVVLHGADWRPGMQKPTNLQAVSLINVLVFVGSDKPEARFRMLCRYALGILELCNAGQSEIGYIFRVAGPVALTESLAPPEFLQAITLPVTIERMETF